MLSHLRNPRRQGYRSWLAILACRQVPARLRSLPSVRGAARLASVVIRVSLTSPTITVLGSGPFGRESRRRTPPRLGGRPAHAVGLHRVAVGLPRSTFTDPRRSGVEFSLALQNLMSSYEFVASTSPAPSG